jgi:hypothetical protein
MNCMIKDEALKMPAASHDNEQMPGNAGVQKVRYAQCVYVQTCLPVNMQLIDMRMKGQLNRDSS